MYFIKCLDKEGEVSRMKSRHFNHQIITDQRVK